MVRDRLRREGLEGFRVEKQGRIKGHLLPEGVVVVASVGRAVNAWEIPVPWGVTGRELGGE